MQRQCNCRQGVDDNDDDSGSLWRLSAVLAVFAYRSIKIDIVSATRQTTYFDNENFAPLCDKPTGDTKKTAVRLSRGKMSHGLLWPFAKEGAEACGQKLQSRFSLVCEICVR